MTASCTLYIFYFYLYMAREPPSGPGPPHYRGSAVTLSYTHHTRQFSSGRGIGPSQRLLPDNIQNSKETSLSPSRIRTRNPSERAVADPRLRPRGHRDRLHLRTAALGCQTITVDFKSEEYILALDLDTRFTAGRGNLSRPYCMLQHLISSG